MRKLVCVFVVASCATEGSSTDISSLSGPCDWTQQAGDATHRSQACGTVDGMVVVGSTIINPDWRGEIGAFDIHFRHATPPLVRDDRAWIPVKVGARTASVYGVRAVDTTPGGVVEAWKFTSDFVAAANSLTVGHEHVFQPVLVGEFLYVPGASGSVHKLDADTGIEHATLRPFLPDPHLRIAGGLTAGPDGSVYYTANAWDPVNALSGELRGAWLVRIAADDTITLVEWERIARDTPAPFDQCITPFPPGTARCGPQRPGVSSAPAIAADGTIYLTGHAHFNPHYAHLFAVNPDLTHRWTASLRGRIPVAQFGLDPATRQPWALHTSDLFTSTPVTLPDGGVALSAFAEPVNGSRGFTLSFDVEGQFRAIYPYGLDTSPAVYEHDGTYSLVLEENTNGFGRGHLLWLSPGLQIEKRFSYGVRSVSVTANPIIDEAGNAYVLAAVAPTAATAYTGVHKISPAGQLLGVAKLGPFQDSLDQGIALAGGRVYAPLRDSMFVVE